MVRLRSSADQEEGGVIVTARHAGHGLDRRIAQSVERRAVAAEHAGQRLDPVVEVVAVRLDQPVGVEGQDGLLGQ